MLSIARHEIAGATQDSGLQNQIVGVVSRNDIEVAARLDQVGRFENPVKQTLCVCATELELFQQIPLELLQNYGGKDQLKLAIQCRRNNTGWWPAEKHPADPYIRVNADVEHASLAAAFSYNTLHVTGLQPFPFGDLFAFASHGS